MFGGIQMKNNETVDNKSKIKFIVWTLAIMLCALSVFLLFARYIQRQKFELQMGIAEKYMDQNNFTEAVNAYNEALRMKQQDYVDIILGLSTAYVGLEDYDTALSVLREAYEKENSKRLTAEIERVSLLQQSSEYNDRMKRAQTYEDNQEYEKAISEYEKARQIKSKESTPYESIARCYMALGRYAEARTETNKAIQTIGETEELEKIIYNIDYAENIDRYHKILEETKDLVYQENYVAAISNYKEAISLLPHEENAYIELANVYVLTKQYENAMSVITSAKQYNTTPELEELYDSALELSLKQQERDEMLKSIYAAAKVKDISSLVEQMQKNEFKKTFSGDYPIYYSEVGEGTFGDGTGMVVYGQHSIYIGSMTTGMRSGNGFYFKWWKDGKKVNYTSYDGEWSKDIPNGYGVVLSCTPLDGNFVYDELYIVKTIGNYVGAMEDNEMSKEIYDSKYNLIGVVQYKSKLGIAQPLLDKKGKIYWVFENKNYIYGRVYLNKKDTGYYLSTTASTTMQIDYKE